jgi:hypothetical protein
MPEVEQLRRLFDSIPGSHKLLIGGVSFISGEYIIWLGMGLILLYGIYKRYNIKEIRSYGGCFLLLITVLVTALYWVYKKIFG